MSQSYLILIIHLFCCTIILAQKASDRQINLAFENKNFIKILYELEQKENIRFYFDPQRIPYFEFTKKYEDKQIWYILNDLLNGALLTVISIDDKSIGIIPTPDLNKVYIENLLSKWKSGEFKYPFVIEQKQIKIITAVRSSSKPSIQLVLDIVDEEDKTSLIGVAVFTDDFQIKEISNEKGTAGLTLKPGKTTLQISYLGYQSARIEVDAFRDTSYILALPRITNLLDEVEISSTKISSNNLKKTIGVESIEMKKLETITQALGEVDIIKSLEILPGVKSTAEVSSGFNVRGGNIDENQVLLNEAVIFNPTHVLGFTSAFNADAIKSVTLSKAYMDPQYGGWNSAVLDIKSSYGNAEKWKGVGSLGTTIGKLTIEGPVNKSLTMMASVRKSYSDWMLRQAYNKEISNSHASFYDYHVAAKTTLSKNHFLLMDHFRTSDNFDYNKLIGYRWSNLSAGLTAVNLWSNKWDSRLSLTMSNYKSVQASYSSPFLYELNTGIKVLKGTFIMHFRPKEGFVLKSGLMALNTRMHPEKIVASESNGITIDQQIQRNGNLTLAAHVSAAWTLSKNIQVEGGLRYTQYYSIGIRKEFQYAGDSLPQTFNITDTLRFSGTSAISGHIEPRFNLNYKLNDHWAIKAAYTKTSQNLHLLVNGNTSLPSDLWIPSGAKIKPRVATQYSAGLAYIAGDGNISISGDVYYKSYSNNIILRDFPDFIQNEHIETELLQGIGKSYGSELALEIKQGNFTGNMAFTYARTFQKNIYAGYKVRDNEFFNSDNDIPHQLNLLLNYRPNPLLSFNTSFIYKDGRPVTLPQSAVIIDGFLIPVYSKRNAFRIPNYYRLDVGITLDFRKIRKKGMRHSFSLGIYNLLGRKNALNVFYRKSEKGNINGYKLSLIGAAIPSLSWNFIF